MQMHLRSNSKQGDPRRKKSEIIKREEKYVNSKKYIDFNYSYRWKRVIVNLDIKSLSQSPSPCIKALYLLRKTTAMLIFPSITHFLYSSTSSLNPDFGF